MAKTLYISDLHLGHQNIMHHDRRPFSCVENMDSEIVRRWNQAVSEEDTVYLLGDILWKVTPDSLKLLRSLKGHKHLIIGNHDKIKSKEYTDCFESVQQIAIINDNGRYIVLSHRPQIFFENRQRGWYHFYAHVHESYEFDEVLNQKTRFEEIYHEPCRMYNVGCMLPYMNYTPQTFDTIVEEGEKMYTSIREAKKKCSGKSIYTVMTMSMLEENDLKMAEFGNSRVVGFYHELDNAVYAVENNACDINEMCYEYAMIEEVKPGLYNATMFKKFYRFNLKTQKYDEIPEPEFMKCICNITIG